MNVFEISIEMQKRIHTVPFFMDERSFAAPIFTTCVCE